MMSSSSFHPPLPTASSDVAEESVAVELAVLGLPSEALTVGLAVGDGNQVVLEASHDIVENLTEMPPEHQLISAVVDLEAMSELVGENEQDFVMALHQDVQDQQRTTDEVESSIAHQDSEAQETTPLIQSGSELETVTEQVTLAADQFIESLADVLPTVDETNDDVVTIVTETAATTPGEDIRMAHDAFLLLVPKTDDDGNVENRFVLALPEIQVEDDSIMTENSYFGAAPLIQRGLSMLPSTTRLPSDIRDVHLEATEHVPDKMDPTDLHLDIVVNRQVPLIGYIILFSGLFALASVGAALDLQTGGVSPMVKTLWRQIATAICILPMVLKSIYYDGIPGVSGFDGLLLIVAAILYAYMSLAFVIALEMTTLANAFVLSNVTSLVIIVGRAILGLPVMPTEGLGAIVGFIGAAVCADGATRTPTSAAALSHPMLGNVVALSASFGLAGYLLIAKRLRPMMDLFVFMFFIMIIGSAALLVYLLISNHELTFDMDPVHGVFGWLQPTPNRLPLELYMALVCNCIGTTGYVAVMKYFAPLVPATVMLLEPVVGALLAVAAGTAPFPNLQTWLGDFIVAIGTFLVIQAGARKTESIDATGALRTKPDDLASLSEHRRLSDAKDAIDSSTSVSSHPTLDSKMRVVWE